MSQGQSYPPSQPSQPSSTQPTTSTSSSTWPSWVPSPLSNLASYASFAYRNIGNLATSYLYARDPLVPARIFQLPLIDFYNRLSKAGKEVGINAFGPGSRIQGTTEAFVYLPPCLPVLVLEIPEIPSDLAFFTVVLHDPYGECVGVVSTKTVQGGRVKVVIVGTRTVGRGLATLAPTEQGGEETIVIVESDSDVLCCTVILSPRDPDDEEAMSRMEHVEPMRFTALIDPSLSKIRDKVVMSGELQARVNGYRKDMVLGDGVLFDLKGKEVVGASGVWKENHLEEWEVAAKIMHHTTIPGAVPQATVTSPLHEPIMMELLDLNLFYPDSNLVGFRAPIKQPQLNFIEDKHLTKLSDASFKGKSLMENYLEVREDPLIARSEALNGWERSPVSKTEPGKSELDLSTTDLLERAFRAANGLVVFPDSELVSYSTSIDSAGTPLDASASYALEMSTEPLLTERGMWTLSVRTLRGEIVDMLTNSTCTRDFPSQSVSVVIGSTMDGEEKGQGVNRLETEGADGGSSVFRIVLEVFGGLGGAAGKWDPMNVKITKL